MTENHDSSRKVYKIVLTGGELIQNFVGINYGKDCKNVKKSYEKNVL